MLCCAHAIFYFKLQKEEQESFLVHENIYLTGLSGGALIGYLIVSETTRVLFPPRNLIPVP